MIIKTLKLTNFRSHALSTFEFSPNLNIITGENAVGKTNVMEAIYYLSLARSFKGVEDSELIKKGSDWGEIRASIKEGETSKDIKVRLNKSARQIFINGKPVSRLSELAKSVNITLFEPKDVMLFRGPPKDRRTFLDISLSKKSNVYLEHISRYEKVLKERNEVLKSDHPDKVLLETTTEMLAKLSAPIVNYRQIYVKDINDILNKITRALTGVQGKIEIIYKPFVDNDEKFLEHAIAAFKAQEETDLKHKATSIGPHREDFSVNLNGRDIATYGSQGENRMVALALKLSPYFLVEERDKRPIVVLDDVMSELDSKHQERLIKFLKKFDQVFITATKLKVDGASHYEIKKNA